MTASASLAGGKPVHYLCDEDNGWMPSLADIRAKITPRTRGIVVINPNNPPGALYSDELLRGIVAIAREHELVLFADEVYDKVLYDGIKHTSMAALSEDVLTIIFNGLSKNYRSCGYRAGWMVVCGDKRRRITGGVGEWRDGLASGGSSMGAVRPPRQHSRPWEAGACGTTGAALGGWSKKTRG